MSMEARTKALSMERCGANTIRGAICGKPAGWGTPYRHGRCKLHGGASSTHLKAAQHREADRAVELFGLPRAVEPHEALLEEAWRTAGHVEWLGGVVRGLEPNQLVHGIAKTVQFGDGTRAVEARGAVNGWVKLYQEERNELERVAGGDRHGHRRTPGAARRGAGAATCPRDPGDSHGPGARPGRRELSHGGLAAADRGRHEGTSELYVDDGRGSASASRRSRSPTSTSTTTRNPHARDAWSISSHNLGGARLAAPIFRQNRSDIRAYRLRKDTGCRGSVLRS